MKRMIDDGMLDTAAKSFIKHYEGANAPTDAPSSENSYFTSIKVAKAKAGARRSINRTVRICAVAAVLMIGLVCALFMGAKEDDLDPAAIKFTKEAYMWNNTNPDSKWNGNVTVSIDLKKVDEYVRGVIVGDGPTGPNEDRDVGAIYEGSISIKTIDGKELYCLDGIRVKYESETGIGYYYGGSSVVVKDKETGRHDYTYTDYDEYGFTLGIYFKEDSDNIELLLYDRKTIQQMGTPGQQMSDDEIRMLEKYHIYVAMDAKTRDEAIKIREQNVAKGIFDIGIDVSYE